MKQYGIVIESWYPFGGRGHTSEHFGNEVIRNLAENYDIFDFELTGNEMQSIRDLDKQVRYENW